MSSLEGCFVVGLDVLFGELFVVLLGLASVGLVGDAGAMRSKIK